jgi:hypothetical protein
MSGINASSSARSVPDWHRVSPVARVEPVRLDTSGADRGPETGRTGRTIPPRIERRPQHTAATAASAYAAHILFEAETGEAAPGAQARARQAYGAARPATGRLLTVA